MFQYFSTFHIFATNIRRKPVYIIHNCRRPNIDCLCGYTRYNIYPWHTLYILLVLQGCLLATFVLCKFKRKIFKPIIILLILSFFSERFLHPNPSERYSYLPFGIGSRVCLGSVIAKMEMFLFCGCLLSKYSIKCPEKEPLPNTKGLSGLTMRPLPFKIYLEERKWTLTKIET